ncbi:Beta-glucosidase [Apiospora hydei]|uniref:beta-glucosidase n=1 Tax=Apiospora hydei TaxID=1337664 RepID=A0ABR1X9P8_9PEZI
MSTSGTAFTRRRSGRPCSPFGHGLSYTSFELGGFRVSQEQQQQLLLHKDRPAEEIVKVAVSVKNVGEVAGAAVVQVYIAQQRTSINRPPKELKGFEKIHLEPKGGGNVTVDIPQRYAASYWDEDAEKWIMEAGTYDVLVGQSSVDVALAGTFTVEKTSWWLGL